MSDRWAGVRADLESHRAIAWVDGHRLMAERDSLETERNEWMKLASLGARPVDEIVAEGQHLCEALTRAEIAEALVKDLWLKKTEEENESGQAGGAWFEPLSLIEVSGELSNESKALLQRLFA